MHELSQLNPNTVIQALTAIVIGGVSWFLKGLMGEVKEMRRELTVLHTEHDMLKETGSCPLMRRREEKEET